MTFGFLVVSRNFARFFWFFFEKFLFYMGRIVSTEWPSLVPPQRIDDCVEIQLRTL